MSGNSGFSGGGVDKDPGYSDYRNSGFGSAMRAYGPGSVGPDPARSGVRPPPGASAVAPPLPKVDLSIRCIVFSAINVVIIAVDTTGSMDGWPLEIFDRLGLLHTELVELLGGPVQILFIGFGDTPACGDPFEVTPIGEGPELLGYLAVINKSSNGGGNDVESADLVLAFVDDMVDASRCKNVFTFITTDEKIRERIDFGRMDPWIDARGQVVPARETTAVVRDLKIKQHVFAIIKPYGHVRELKKGEDPMVLFNDHTTRSVLDNWCGVLGQDWIARLPDKRRVVDVILGCVAKVIGKGDAFMTRLASRQLSATHGFGTINIKTVKASIASIGGSVLKPMTRSRALLPPGDPPAPPAHPVIDVEHTSEAPAGLPQARSSRLLPP